MEKQITPCRRCFNSAYKRNAVKGETTLCCMKKKQKPIEYDQLVGTCKYFKRDSIELHTYE